MKKHFADMKPGERFKMNGTVYEKIEPVFSKRGTLKANIKNANTGSLARCRGLAMVEVEK